MDAPFRDAVIGHKKQALAMEGTEGHGSSSRKGEAEKTSCGKDRHVVSDAAVNSQLEGKKAVASLVDRSVAPWPGIGHCDGEGGSAHGAPGHRPHF